MPAYFRAQGTLAQHIAELPWPEDFFTVGDLPEFLQQIHVLESRLATDDRTLTASAALGFEDELDISLPGLDGFSLVIKGGDVEGISILEFLLYADREGGFIELSGLRFALRVSRDILTPVDDQGRPLPGHAEIALDGSLRVTSNFDFEFDGFERIDLPPCMIASTGIIISAENVKLDLLRTGSIPEIEAAGFDESFLGVFLGEARVTLPPGFPALAPEHLVLTNCAIGTGGVSGRLSASYAPFWNPALREFTGPGSGELFGMKFGLQQVAIELRQNALIEARFTGSLLLPFFEQRFDVELGFDLDGGLSARIGATNGLTSLTIADVLRFDLESVSFALKEDVFVAALSGAITPLIDIGGTWPSIQVGELAIDSRGHVYLDGGWLDLPQQYSIALYGFQFDLTQIGFGRTEAGGNWCGFSGSIQLVDPLPAGASVDGLRIVWGEAGPPRISLEGVGVRFEVPDVLRFAGAVSLRELSVNTPSGTERVHRFDGDVSLELLALDLRIDATLVVGSAEGAQGRYNFCGLYLGADLPAGIPLFSTGLSLYGLAGLFALQMEPDRAPDEPWYGLGEGEGWYKRNPIGVTDLKNKWTNRRGSLALGAGFTFGTTPDNGFLFSGRAMLVLVFPGPILMIEGKANLLAERNALDEEPMFRAIAVLDGRAGSVLFGLDAAYKIGSGGELIDIRGSAESYFNFSDPSSWYLNIGQDEPREKRIRAEMISLFEASAYFMVDPRRVQMGAWVGYSADWRFDPFAVVLEAWIDGNARVSWSPTYFYGDLWLHGKFGIEAFGISLGLSADAIFLAAVFDPLHIRADFRLTVTLPLPFPDLEAEVTLEWGPELELPLLPKPLREVAIEHRKSSRVWPLPVGKLLLPVYERTDAQGAIIRETQGLLHDANRDGIPNSPTGPLEPVSSSSVPVVPLDAMPVLTFSHSIHDDAHVGGNEQRLEPEVERVGDPDAQLPNGVGPATIRYALTGVILQRREGSNWTTIAAKGTDPDGPLPDQLLELYGMWDPVPRLPAGAAAQPDAGVGQYKLRIGARTPFDYVARGGSSWEEWFSDRFPRYPCIPAAPIRRVCFDALALNEGSLASPHDPDVHPDVSVAPVNGGLSVEPVSFPGFSRAFRADGGIDLMLGERAKHVELVADAIAFDDDERCAYFDQLPAGSGPNPRIAADAMFIARDATGAMLANTSILAADGRLGLYSDRSLEIVLPCFAINVRLTISHLATVPVVQAYDPSGALVASQTPNVPRSAVIDFGTIRIARIIIAAPQREAFLHDFCYTCRTEVPATVTALGLGPQGQQYGPEPAAGGRIDLWGTDLVRVEVRGGAFVRLAEACIEFIADPAEVALREELSERLLESTASWEHTDLLLPPSSDYRLKIVTKLVVQGEGAIAGYALDQQIVEYAHFRTEGPPGLATISIPEGHPELYAEGPGTNGVPVEPQSGLEDLSLYVAGTVPVTQPGGDAVLALARPVYRAYDVGVAFNENYVDLMYKLARRDLGLYLYDRNNQPARDPEGRLLVLTNRWGDSEQLTLNESETRWVQMLDESACAEGPLRELIRRDRTLTSAAIDQVLDPQTLYEARLIPLLVHDVFEDLPLDTPVGGGTSLGAWTIYDDGPQDGPSEWKIVEEGAPPSRYLLQTSQIGPAPVPTESSVRPGTYAITGDPAWSHVRASAFVRSGEEGDFGVVFRWQSSQAFYRFSMNRAQRRRRLVAVNGGEHRVLAEDDVAFEIDRHYLVTIETIGSRLTIYLDGELVFDATDTTFATGRFGFYASSNGGARFSDVRIDDFHQDASIVYRFGFETSRFKNFYHHVHDHQDRSWTQAIQGSLAEFEAAAQSAAMPADAPTDGEHRAYDDLAERIFGTGAHQAPERTEATIAHLDQAPRAIVLRSPELWTGAGGRSEPTEVDWSRVVIGPVRHSARRAHRWAPPKTFKITGAGFGTQRPDEEWIELLAQNTASARGVRLQYLAAPSVVDERDRGEVLLEDPFDREAGLLHREAFGPNAVDLYDVNLGDQAGYFRVQDGHIVYFRPSGSMQAYAIIGDQSWSDVRVRASLRFEGGTVSIVVRYHSYFNDNYWFRLSAGSASFGRQSLVLWHEALPIVADQTYQIELFAFRNRFTALLDGRYLFTVEDDFHEDGRVALGALATNALLHYEAFEVESLTEDPIFWSLVPDSLGRFRQIDTLAREAMVWNETAGAIERSTALTATQQAALAIIGDASWEDVQVSARITSSAGTISGLLARVSGGETPSFPDFQYYLFALDLIQGRLVLYKRVFSTTMTMQSVPWSGTPGTAYDVSISCEGSLIRCHVDGVLVIERRDSDFFLGGGAGLWSEGAPTSSFANIGVLDRARHAGVWQLRDAGAIDGPSDWRVRHGRMIQTSMIGDNSALKAGTQAIAGDAEWRDYRVRAELRSDAEGAIGVVFRYVDERNYYRFSMDRRGPERRLDRVVDGTMTTLVSDAVAYPLGERMTIIIDAIGSRLRVYHGSALIFDELDESHPQGKVGLYTHENDGANFFDVSVELASIEAFALFRDRFAEGSSQGWQFIDAGTQGGSSIWAPSGGVLLQSGNTHSFPVDPASLPKEGTIAIAGDPTWTDLVFEARLRSDDEDGIGVIFRYVDGNNYYRLSMHRTGGYRRLVKKVNGTFFELWSDTFTFPLGRAHLVGVVLAGSSIRVYFDNAPIAAIEDSSHASGRIGLYAWRNVAAAFSEVRVYPISIARDRWLLNDDFSALDTNRWSFVDAGDIGGPGNWHLDGGDLVQTSSIRGSAPFTDRGTHAIVRSAPHRDVRLSVRLRTTSSGAIGVVFRYVEEQDYYRFSLHPSAPNLRLTKVEGGQPVVLWQAAGPFALGKPYYLTIDAIGDQITGYLNGEQLFTITDSAHAAGFVGLYCSDNPGARFEEVRVAAAEWSTYYTFRGPQRFGAGQRIRVEAAGDSSAFTAIPGVIRRHAVGAGEAGRLRLPARGAQLRVIEPDGGGHERLCLADSELAPFDVDVLRKRDGSGVILVPRNGAPLGGGIYRVQLAYRRNLNAADGVVFSENGADTDEVAVIDVGVETVT